MEPYDVDLREALSEAVRHCAEMIDATNFVDQHSNLSVEPLSSLFEECSKLINSTPIEPETIRTVHHFACTGGTLISKCLACMPNVQLLSEVEPFSQISADRRIGFHPTDQIQQLRNSSRGSDTRLEAETYLAGLRVLYLDCVNKGLRLVMREHSHSHYCVGSRVAETPLLQKLVGRIVPVSSIVTVRHPLDSYLSVEKQGWLHFEPATLDEYCLRYLHFLDDYNEVRIFKYEDFLASPESNMQAMCEALGLPFAPGFEDFFSVHRLSGDSGRSAETIEPRVRRTISEVTAGQARASDSYASLCDRLQYEP